MPEGDSLSRFLSDEENMKKVIEVAGTLLGPKPDRAEAPAEPAEPAQAAGGVDLASLLSLLAGAKSAEPTASSARPAQAAAGIDFGSLLSSLTGAASAGTAVPPAESAQPGGAAPDAIVHMLSAVIGDKTFIDTKKANLIHAMRPYMAETRSSSLDRAIRMANLAKAAKSALGLLGRNDDV